MALETGLPERFPSSEVQEILACREFDGFNRTFLVKRRGRSHADTEWLSLSAISEFRNGSSVYESYHRWHLPTMPPFVNPCFCEPEMILDVGPAGSLIKWRGLPIGWSTWKKEFDQSLIRKRSLVNSDLILDAGDDLARKRFDDDQISTIRYLFQRIRVGGETGLVGKVGSVMRCEAFAAISLLSGDDEAFGPVLVICDDSMVRLVVQELREVIEVGVCVLESDGSADDMEVIARNFWCDASGRAKFDIAVLGTTACTAMDERMNEIQWAVAIVDGVTGLGKRVEDHVKGDFLVGDEIDWFSGADAMQEIRVLVGLKHVKARSTVMLLRPGCVPDLVDWVSAGMPFDGIVERVVLCQMSISQRIAYSDVFRDSSDSLIGDAVRDDRYISGLLDSVCLHPRLLIGKTTKEDMCGQYCKESGKLVKVVEVIERAQMDGSNVLFVMSDRVTLDLLECIVENMAGKYCRTDTHELATCVGYQFAACVVMPGEILDCGASEFNVVVLLSPSILPSTITGPHKTVCKAIELVRLITIDSHEMNIAARRSQHNWYPRTVDFALSCFQLPLPVVVRHAEVVLVEEYDRGVLYGEFDPWNYIDGRSEVCDPSDFETEFSPEVVHEILVSATTFCWGRWDAMLSEVSMPLSRGAMIEVVCMLLGRLVNRVKSTSSIIKMVLRHRETSLDANVLENLMIVCDHELERWTDELILYRIRRIEQMMIMSLFMSLSKNPPNDISVYSVGEPVPRFGWSENDDQNLVNCVFCNGYGRFGEMAEIYGYGRLCDRLRMICSAYQRELNIFARERREEPIETHDDNFGIARENIDELQAPGNEIDAERVSELYEGHEIAENVGSFVNGDEESVPDKQPCLVNVDESGPAVNDIEKSEVQDEWGKTSNSWRPVRNCAKNVLYADDSNGDDLISVPARKTSVKHLSVATKSQEAAKSHAKVRGRKASSVEETEESSVVKPVDDMWRPVRKCAKKVSYADDDDDGDLISEPVRKRSVKSSVTNDREVVETGTGRLPSASASKVNENMAGPIRLSGKGSKMPMLQKGVRNDDDVECEMTSVDEERAKECHRRLTKGSSGESKTGLSDTTVKLRLRGPGSRSPEPESKQKVDEDSRDVDDSSHQLSQSEHRLVARVLESFGPISVSDLRLILALQRRSDKAIESSRSAILSFVHSDSELPFEPKASLKRSVLLFEEMARADLDNYFEEDRVVLEIVILRGLENSIFSPLLKWMFHERLSSSEVIEICERTLKHQMQKDCSSQRKMDVSVPLIVSKGVTVTSFGSIRPGFYHDNDYIYPVGYTARTEYLGRDVVCSVISGASGDPVFSIAPVSGASCRVTCSGYSPDAAWRKFFTDVAKLSPDSLEARRPPGHELFGFASPLTKIAIQSLPGVEQCKKYKMKAFRKSFRADGPCERLDSTDPDAILLDFRPIFNRFQERYGSGAPLRFAFPTDSLPNTITISEFRQDLEHVGDLSKRV